MDQPQNKRTSDDEGTQWVRCTPRGMNPGGPTTHGVDLTCYPLGLGASSHSSSSEAKD